MLFYTIGQSNTFLVMTAAGMLIGFVYDAIALMRHLMQAGLLLSAATDALFGVLAAVVTIAFLVPANYGDLRLYTLLGVTCGLIIYFFAFSPLLRGFAHALTSAAKKMNKTLSRNRLIKVIFK